MLKWFVSVPDSNKAIKDGVLLDEASIEMRHEKIPNACIDENVNLFRIRKYFTDDGWVQVLQAVKMKKANPVYYCQVCERKLLQCNTICCDCCLEWLHFSCAGVKSAPKQKEWFCKLCRVNNNNDTKNHNVNDKPLVIPKVHIISRVTFQPGTAANRLRDRREKERLQRGNEKAMDNEQTITLSSDEELICEEPEEPGIDIAPGVKVFQSDLNILKTPLGWLNARLINAGQALLRRKFPNLGGLQDVGKSDTCTFDEQTGDFVQVLNCYESH